MDLKPSRIEEFVLGKKSMIFIKRLNKNLRGAEAIIGGSVAKGTWLKGEHDVDVFVLFYRDGGLSDLLEVALKKSFKDIERIKGSRDYFQVRAYGLNFEIVPVLRIKHPKDAKNITDVSPMHIEWVKKNIGRLNNDVRLLKRFCKAQGVYGAESYIKGFSGYVTEILIIYHKGFKNLVKNAVNWKSGIVLDVEGHKTKIEKSKLSPLVIIDPVDNKRNAAAALSQEKFKRFISACKGYLTNPGKDFFEIKNITIKDLKDKDIVLKVIPLEGRKDIVGAKLLRCLELIRGRLKEEGYSIIESDWYWNEYALFWFKVKSVELPPYKKHYGPPIHMKENVNDFRLKWKGYKILEDGNRVYVNIPRENIKLSYFMDGLIKSEDFRMYVNGIRIIS